MTMPVCRSTWTFLVCAPAHLPLSLPPTTPPSANNPPQADIPPSIVCSISLCAATLCVSRSRYLVSLFGFTVWVPRASGANCRSPSMSGGVVPCFPGVMTTFIFSLSLFSYPYLHLFCSHLTPFSRNVLHLHDPPHLDPVSFPVTLMKRSLAVPGWLKVELCLASVCARVCCDCAVCCWLLYHYYRRL